MTCLDSEPVREPGKKQLYGEMCSTKALHAQMLSRGRKSSDAHEDKWKQLGRDVQVTAMSETRY
jgi:hypothetical protein